jgi:hypothetical protein
MRFEELAIGACITLMKLKKCREDIKKTVQFLVVPRRNETCKAR